MHLDRVTITGADDSVSPRALACLSAAYPCVEWGILASASHAGVPRFPSHPWIRDLQGQHATTPLALSLHLCGRWVHHLLNGFDAPPWLFASMRRVQLNFHGEDLAYAPVPCWSALRRLGDRQIIFQIDGAHGFEYWQAIRGQNGRNGHVDAVPLWETSGGPWRLPDYWPFPVTIPDGPVCLKGYAGGLGPENLGELLAQIAEAAGDASIWIDLETHVRSADGQRLDLDKVIACLDLAQPYVAAQEKTV